MLLGLCLSLSFATEMFQTVPEDKATLVQEGDAKRYCPNCGMDLVKFHKTNHVHENHQYCSLHCLVEDTKGVMPKDAKVVDAENLGFIEANTAFYVVGSAKPGTMTMNSKYAFSSQSDAKAFVDKNGGRIVAFEEAYEIAKEDFAEDVAMLKNKREQKVYDVGQRLYQNGCEKVNVTSFSTIAALKVSLKKACRLESDAQRQMVAVYLWDHKNNTATVGEEKIVVPKNAKCPICGMFVAKYPQWAAVIETTEEKFYFDGVKDMMKYIFAQKKNFEHAYVSDYYSLKKILNVVVNGQN